MARKERQRSHVVDRDREESLDLSCVEVHRQHAIGPGQLKHVGHKTAGDRLTWLRLAVLASVRKQRHDRSDSLRRRQLRGLDHEEELHEVAVDRFTAGLQDEHVRAADRLLVPAVGFAVRERLQLDLAQLDSELLGDLLRKLSVGTTGEYHQPLLRGQGYGVPGAHLRQDRRDVEPRKRLLNRPAFHRVLPC